MGLGANDTEAVSLATKGLNPEMWVQTVSCCPVSPSHVPLLPDFGAVVRVRERFSHTAPLTPVYYMNNV